VQAFNSEGDAALVRTYVTFSDGAVSDYSDLASVVSEDTAVVNITSSPGTDPQALLTEQASKFLAPPCFEGRSLAVANRRPAPLTATAKRCCLQKRLLGGQSQSWFCAGRLGVGQCTAMLIGCCVCVACLM
jgi:hypothetical protein